MPALHKQSLVTLKLSSPSFLDAAVSDDHGSPALYTIRTNGATTRVTRSDPWDGPTEITAIKWPPTNQKSRGRFLEGTSIQVRCGRWEPVENVLRQCSLLSPTPRKFNIPGYSKTLKWKAVGDRYWCVSPSVQGPIATLDPAVGSVPPRLKVYETFHGKHDSSTMLVHQGVSLLLLDWLLLTSLLLVTDSTDISSLLTETSSSFLATPANGRSWKKLLPRDTLFWRRSISGNLPPSTTSLGQMAKIVHGDPIYPTLRTPTSGPSLVDSDSEDDEYDSEADSDADEGTLSAAPSVVRLPSSSHAPSPSQESVCYPLRNASAPSHTYIDPSFYADPDAPPVPPLPAFGAISPSSSSSTSSRHRSIPRTPSVSTLSSRRLPEPPEPFSPPRAPYIYSSSRRPSTAPSGEPRRPHSSSGSSMLSSPVTPSDASFRRLPIPPSQLQTLAEAPEARRKDSHDELSAWLFVGSSQANASGSRITVMELPPPAYSSINFGLPEEVPPSQRPLPHAPLL